MYSRSTLSAFPAGFNETVSKARELMLLQLRKEDRHRAKSRGTVAAASTSTTDQVTQSLVRTRKH